MAPGKSAARASSSRHKETKDTSKALAAPTQYNKQTGRPIRRGAGKAKAAAGYVDIAVLQELDEEDLAQLSSDSSDDADDQPRRRPAKRRKRDRSPTPPTPEFDRIISMRDLDELTDYEDDSAAGRRKGPKQPVMLRFDVPLGFHGPLFVKLDSTMLRTDETDKTHTMQAHPTSTSSSTAKPTKQVGKSPRAGFTDLPPELRNKIYRLLFVREDVNGSCKDFKIPATRYHWPLGNQKLSQSAQFLRTCRLVYSEACSVLYGENVFSFDRHESTRGPFWEHEPREIGYLDLLQFLKMIGPENLQHLRDVRLCLSDARPSDMPHTYSEDRRYLSDEVLLHCIRILRHAKLRTLQLAFGGRRQLLRSDSKFLSYLEQIKADELTKWASPRGYRMDHKVGHAVWEELTQQMVRKKKLYEKDEKVEKIAKEEDNRSNRLAWTGW